MKLLHYFLFVFVFSFDSFSHAVHDGNIIPIAREQLLSHAVNDGKIIPIAREQHSTHSSRENHHHKHKQDQNVDKNDHHKQDQNVVNIDHPHITFPNLRLKKAHNALQALKNGIFSDPKNFTSNWNGPDVCTYNGVFCAKALDNANHTVVAGIDLNHADIAGNLPQQLEHLTDISILHLNSNRFSGFVPKNIKNLKLLHELDLSNNRFNGPFPKVVLELPNLKYLDLRYNDFHGELPYELFDKDLDAIFLNNNRFQCSIPQNIGNSPASVVVMANNRFTGSIPKSIGKMAGKLDEIILSNNDLSGCLPEEIASLKSTTVLDISNNKLNGDLPKGMENMQSLEILNIANNKFKSKVSKGICTLPSLKNFTFSSNYFDTKDEECKFWDDKKNCFATDEYQRAEKECRLAFTEQVCCSESPVNGISSKQKPSNPSKTTPRLKSHMPKYSFSPPPKAFVSRPVIDPKTPFRTSNFGPNLAPSPTPSKQPLITTAPSPGPQMDLVSISTQKPSKTNPKSPSSVQSPPPCVFEPILPINHHHHA